VVRVADRETREELLREERSPFALNRSRRVDSAGRAFDSFLPSSV